ncbi:MAG: hypothetical protein OXN97_05450 [Bryobacterales bacterium]|nr:hypothetical protein [Bryobacterales bacterium]
MIVARKPADYKWTTLDLRIGYAGVVSPELIGILGVGAALGCLMWKFSSRINRLEAAHYDLAKEFAELRGEIRWHFRMHPVSGD